MNPFTRWLDAVRRKHTRLLVRAEIQQIKARIAELEAQCADTSSMSREQRLAVRTEIQTLRGRLDQLGTELENATGPPAMAGNQRRNS